MENYAEWLAQMAESLRNKAKEFENSYRVDEANLMKIKANVYEICETVLLTFKKAKQKGELNAEYLNMLSRLRCTWEASLKAAEEHGDVKKLLVEQMKLAALSEAEIKFKELGGE